MASLENLPADQRAVLQLVLKQGRSYDDIARLLSIDRAAVRQRALAALDSMGPQTGVAPERRALITDYLLGQLPPRVSDDTRVRLGESPSERAWARVVASELTPIASNPLPEIPTQPVAPEAAYESGAAAAAPAALESEREPSAHRAERESLFLKRSKESDREERPQAEPRPPRTREPRPARGDGRRTSRLGGGILIGIAVVGIVVALILITTGGGSNKHPTTTTTANEPTTTATAGQTTNGTTGTATTPQVVRQINLTSPQAPKSKTAGLADVLKQGNTHGIAIIAQNVPPNTKHDAYAVWLYNSPSDAHILGFVNPGVGSNGRLSTAGPLPTNAAHFTKLIVTLETQGNPKQPGKIVLQGPFALS